MTKYKSESSLSTVKIVKGKNKVVGDLTEIPEDDEMKMTTEIPTFGGAAPSF